MREEKSQEITTQDLFKPKTVNLPAHQDNICSFSSPFIEIIFNF